MPDNGEPTVEVASEVVLSVSGVSKSFPDGRGTRRVLHDVALDVRAGSMVAVTGPSGCGKTTLLKIVTGLLRPDEGEVIVANRALDYARPTTIARTRREHIGLVTQEYGLLEDESALENVTLPLRFGPTRVRGRARKEAGLRAIRLAGLDVDPKVRTSQLSSGERQRVATARAVVRHPSLLVADEPTAFLDSETGARVVALLRSLAERRAAVLVATHDPRVANACDLVLRFAAQRLELVG